MRYIIFLTARPPFCVFVFFFAFFVYSVHLPIYSIAMSDILCDDIMSEWSKI